MKKKRLKFILFLFIGIMSASFVAAQALDTAFDALDELGIIGSFTKHPIIWDAIVILTVFIVLGRRVLGKKVLDSEGAGGAIGFALGAIALGGLQFIPFSLVKNLGPWAAIAFILAAMVWLIRLFIAGENKGTVGALGTFLILTIFLSYDPIKNYIKDASSLLFGILMLLWVFSGAMTIVWGFQSISSSLGQPNPGGAGRFLGRRGDSARSLRDGARNLRDGIFNRPSQEDINNLTQRVHTFQGEVARFTTQLQNLISYIGHPATNRSARTAALRPNDQVQFNNQINNQLTPILPFQARIVTEAASILGDRAYGRLEATEQANFAGANLQLINIQGDLALALA